MSMTVNPFLAGFEDKPALVASHNRAWFESCLQGAAELMPKISAQAATASVDDDWWGEREENAWLRRFRPYVVKDGVLQIPIKGVLLHDFAYQLFNWATGYDYIWRAFERGMGDANVKGIALVVDSPGGMVAGCFEMVDKMYALRGQKPVAGFASESAYSAAYASISVADPGKLYVTRTGGVGSIGVVTSHVDYSGMMEQRGLKITFIHAGAHKVDGNPYEALPADVKARIQARIDDFYSVFVSTVARNRGLDEQAVRDTEALTFGAVEATSNGLADKIGALDDSLADFSASLSLEEGDDTMADITQADHESALATARTEATAQGQREGAAAERTRITAILNSDAGQARPTAALAAALETDMTSEQAVAFLAKLPEEPKADASTTVVEPEGTAGAPAGMFKAAMDKTPNPNIEATEQTEQSDEDVMLEQSFGGRKPKKSA